MTTSPAFDTLQYNVANGIATITLQTRQETSHTSQEVLRAIATPAFRERLTALNVPVSPALTPAQFRKVVADDTVAWHHIAETAGVKPE